MLTVVLFNIYTHDIVLDMQGVNIELLSYIDDIIVSSLGETPVQVLQQLQRANNAHYHWTVDSVENRMSAQPDKGKWMMATRIHIRSYQQSKLHFYIWHRYSTTK